jgi:hypothetical protein
MIDDVRWDEPLSVGDHVEGIHDIILKLTDVRYEVFHILLPLRGICVLHGNLFRKRLLSTVFLAPALVMTCG